jgi:zinc protease
MRPLLAAALILTLGCAHQASSPSTSTSTSTSTDLGYWANRGDLIRPPPPPMAEELPLPGIARWRLDNGLDVIVVPRRDLPVVSFSVAIRAGSYDEEKDRTQGVADFTAAMLRKGTATRTADEISQAIDFIGGSLDAGASMQSSTAGCTSLTKDAPLCLDLLADVLLRPTFPEAEMAEVRDQVLAALGARHDDPHQLAAEHFDNFFFGEDHPDGWVLEPAHVKRITRAQLQAFWQSTYRPNNAILAIAGDVDAATMRAQIERLFGAWQAGPVLPRPADRLRLPEHRGTRVLLVDKPDLTQATLMFGSRGLRHTDRDWYAATLVNYVLGGSDFSSRLMIEVRAKRGLTYGIGSSFGATLYEGAFRVSAATRNESAVEAFSVAVDEIRKMKRAGPTAVELAKAKGFYAGSYPLGLESAAGVARNIVAAELHGLGLDYVRRLPLRLSAVALAQAQAAALERLDPDNLSVVVVGKAEAIEPQLAAAKLPFERVDFRAPIGAAARSKN